MSSATSNSAARVFDQSGDSWFSRCDSYAARTVRTKCHSGGTHTPAASLSAAKSSTSFVAAPTKAETLEWPSSASAICDEANSLAARVRDDRAILRSASERAGRPEAVCSNFSRASSTSSPSRLASACASLRSFFVRSASCISTTCAHATSRSGSSIAIVSASASKAEYTAANTSWTSLEMEAKCDDRMAVSAPNCATSSVETSRNDADRRSLDDDDDEPWWW
mmetsp:Transcript_4466/g.18151  ORF Transcript_4466/g.18151 Transcript_4466/m.18151 type:complete len:223 (-) Transcript_4466:659-1327(-)